METNLNEYQEFYKKYKEQIEKANNCVLSFPCSKLVAEIDKIINYLQGLTKTSDWDDSAKTKFDESINALVTEFNTLKDNINSSWVEAEEIYKSLPEFFEHLNENICYLKIKLDHPIIKNNYRKVNELGEVTYPKYEGDLKEWQYNCNAYNDACKYLISEIEGKLTNLDSINNSSIEMMNLVVTSLGSISPNITASIATYFGVNYYVCQSSEGYSNLKKQEPDKCWNYAINYARKIIRTSNKNGSQNYSSLTCHTKEELLQIAAKEILEGKPSIIQVNGIGKNRHFVTIGGLKEGADLNNLKESDFLILDPAYAGLKQLDVEVGGEIVRRYLVSAQDVTHKECRDNEYLIAVFNDADEYLSDSVKKTKI